MDQNQKTINEGLEAEQLLSNEAFKRATESVELAIHQTWANTPLRDHEGQRELRLMLKLLHDLTGNLRVAIANGKFAENELQIKRTSLEAIRRATKAL